MNPAIWIAIFFPMFVLFFIILPQQRSAIKGVVLKIKNKGDVRIMINEIINKYIGKQCEISTGTFGINVEGKILEVNNNWIEIETKKGNELINAEFIQRIKVK
ncbi:DUF6897 domain-containing protein [Anaeromonas frigoriresistens]|nr:hypothetical protein [Anaeromonas frigoriresistens]